MSSETKVFRIAKPGKRAAIFVAGLILFTLILAATVGYAAFYDDSLAGVVAAVFTGALILFIDTIFIWFGYAAYNIKYVIDKDSISIKNTLYGRTIKKSIILKKGVASVELNKHSIYKPVIRCNAVGMPGFGAGWFMLKNKQDGLLFVTDRSKVVCIPTQKYILLISVENPVEFLQAIKEIWGIES